MEKLVKIEGYNHLYRDIKSKAIVSVDDNKRQAYRNQKVVMQEHINMKQDVKQMKDDIDDIKNMLKILIENKG